MVDLEAVPEALGIMWEYTLNTHIHIEEQFSLVKPLTIMLLGNGWNTDSLMEFHVGPRRTQIMRTQSSI